MRLVSAITIATSIAVSTGIGGVAPAAHGTCTGDFNVSTVSATDIDLDALGEAIERQVSPLPDDATLELVAALPATTVRPASGAAPTGQVAGWRADDGSDIVILGVDDGGVGMSGLAVRLRAGQVVASIEAHVTAGAGHDVTIRQWVDGAIAARQTLDATGASTTRVATTTYVNGRAHNSLTVLRGVGVPKMPSGGRGAGLGLLGQSTGATTEVHSGRAASVRWHPFSISRFNRCLLNAGISLWVVTMAGIVCGATASCPRAQPSSDV